MNEQIKNGAYKKKGAAKDSMAVPAEKLEKIQDTEGGAKKKGAAKGPMATEKTAKQLKAEGKELKQAARDKKKADRKASRATKKSKRKSNRSKKLQDKIDLQEFKGKQKLADGDKLGSKAKQDRIAKLKARKLKADGASKKKGAALISGKPPKPKGKTTPNTNRLGKTFYDKGKEFVEGFVSHLGQSVSNDINTVKNYVTGSGKHNGAGKIGGFTQNFGPARQNSYAKGAARVAQIMGKGAGDVIEGSTHKHPHVGMSQEAPPVAPPVVVTGDSDGINTDITSTKGKFKKLSPFDQNSREFKRSYRKATIDTKRDTNMNLKIVQQDLNKNKRTQLKRKYDGMDYQANTGTDNQKTIRRS